MGLGLKFNTNGSKKKSFRLLSLDRDQKYKSYICRQSTKKENGKASRRELSINEIIEEYRRDHHLVRGVESNSQRYWPYANKILRL